MLHRFLAGILFHNHKGSEGSNSSDSSESSSRVTSSSLSLSLESGFGAFCFLPLFGALVAHFLSMLRLELFPFDRISCIAAFTRVSVRTCVFALSLPFETAFRAGAFAEGLSSEGQMCVPDEDETFGVLGRLTRSLRMCTA